MPSLRILTIAAATALAAGPSVALAQSCFGIPMTGKNYVGIEQRESWTGQGRQAAVYGARYANRFDAGAGVGIIASIEGAGGAMPGDSTAVHASASLSTSRRLSEIDRNATMCAGVGLEGRAFDHPNDDEDDGDGFGSIPLSLGFGYDVHLGRLTLTPYAAPTIAYYQFESEPFRNGARQKGWDGYVTMGATAALFERFSVGASYRNGDRSLGESGRFAFTSGVSF